MGSSMMPEPPKSADWGPLTPRQDSASGCTTDHPTPLDIIADAEPTFPVFTNDGPAGQVLNHDENIPSIQEASIPVITASQATPEEPPADEKHGPPIRWCQVQLKDPTPWAKFNMLDRPGGRQGHRPIGAPQVDTVTTKHSTTGEAVSVQSHSPETPQIKYLNRFLDFQGHLVTIDPWSEALDLDQERGKAAGSKAQHHKTIIELVTTVRTNIDLGLRAKYQHGYVDSQTILSDPGVTAEFVGREVVINSVRIINAFKTLIKYHPGIDLRGMTMIIPEPYCVFYHYEQELKALQKTHDASIRRIVGDKRPETVPIGPDSCDVETIEHLKILCDFIEGQNLEDVEFERKRHRRNPPVATYRMMWLLFKPGTRVYHFNGGRASAGVVISFQTDSASQIKGSRSLRLWSLDFDGFKLGRRERSHNFRPFDGEKRISELPVCPCDIYDARDSNHLRDELINRGKKFWKFLPGAQVDYEGRLPDKATEWRGRVIIDPTTYTKYSEVGRGENDFGECLRPPVVGKVQDTMNSQARLEANLNPYVDITRLTTVQKLANHRWEAQELSAYEDGPWAEYENIIPGETRSLELGIAAATQDRDARYLLCPKDVIGFDLKTRRWLLLDVACCYEVVFNDDAVNNLVMNDDRKMVIKSLVHRYTITETATTDVLRSGISRSKSSQPWTADFIKNKGDGQIFLLHGGPGVGKTYTAECIAEATRRPLLSLTCGDFGTNETTVEKKLSKWFRLAEVWGAVMLLDEADVFLERRQLNDLKRNSLVSGNPHPSIWYKYPRFRLGLLQDFLSVDGPQGLPQQLEKADNVAVFLRTMEYYRGILFLTTNRVGNFDDAFISRIHTVIHYDGFTDAERQRIWEQFFKKLEVERRTTMKVDPDARKYVLNHEDMKNIQWNGREIRNAFQTAVAFAEYRFSQFTSEEKEQMGDRARLEAEDFVKVSEMTMAFKKYLKSIKRDEDTVARMGGYR